jgi:UDP:flavonoid glycosyltransferase YjiC (YdhE family)
MWIAYDSPPIFSPWRPPMWSRRPLLRVFRALLNSLFRRWLNGPAAALAVPKRRDWYFANFADATINLGMWSAAFSPAPADAPPRHVLSGFPIIADDGSMAALPDELRTFLEAGTPPVVVGLGTSARDVGGPIYRAAAEACEQLGERCLLIGPKSREGLPLSAFVVRSAPYVPVFAKARAVLHHGGVNTTAETLRAGLPSIVVPFAADQYDNAERVERLGVGRMIRQGRATKAELASALRHLLAPAIVERARLLGGQLRAEGDGARRAVTALETLIPPRSPGAFRAAHPSGRMDS